MNDLAFCHSSTVQCPIPCVPRERSRPVWEVKMGDRRGQGEPQTQAAEKPFTARGGGRGLPPLPHSLLPLAIADGKAKAPPGCQGGSATAESRVRPGASWVVWCSRLQGCLLGGGSSCVFAKVGFNFLFQWAKWWVEFVSHIVHGCTVVFRAWVLSESLLGCQESSVHTKAYVVCEAWGLAPSNSWGISTFLPSLYTHLRFFHLD